MKCPNCGDTRLFFNLRPSGRYDVGDLFACVGCGIDGESIDLIEEELVEAES